MNLHATNCFRDSTVVLVTMLAAIACSGSTENVPAANDHLPGTPNVSFTVPGSVSLPPEQSRSDPGPEQTANAEVDNAASALDTQFRAQGHTDAFARCVRNELAARLHGPELSDAIRALSSDGSSTDPYRALVPEHLSTITDLCRALEHPKE